MNMYEQEEPVYKMIHAIDPSKINVPIREQFAKLTLSSNKNKQDTMEGKGAVLQNNPKPDEKRKSASRNLMDLLTASEGGGQAAESFSGGPPQFTAETQLEDLEEQAAIANRITTEHSEVIERFQMNEQIFSLLTSLDRIGT